MTESDIAFAFMLAPAWVRDRLAEVHDRTTAFTVPPTTASPVTATVRAPVE